MRIVHFLGAILALISSPVMAKDAVSTWIVTQKSGDVRVIHNGLQPASVQVRAALSPGDIIATAANGRAMITKGDDYVVVAPGSRLMLPKEQQQTGFTRLVQQVGTMLYKVKRTGVPHFSVETPMLAAVVKGTTFTVVVDSNRAAVQVTEGVVEVSSVAGDARRLVEGGMTVYVGRERPNDILEVRPDSADLPKSGDDEPVKVEGSGDVALATITNLTGGLVREAPVAPIVTATNGVSAGIAPVIPGSLSAVPTTVAPTPVAGLPQVDPSSLSAPVTAIVETTIPAITEPVVDLVETVVTPVTAPVVDLVETIVTPVTAPVIDIVETIVTPVTAPVVDIVEAVVIPVTAPVVDIVEAVVTPVIAPVIDIVEAIVPPILGGLFGPK
jgi:FecR-like protein